jgi:hypothetical protein
MPKYKEGVYESGNNYSPQSVRMKQCIDDTAADLFDNYIPTITCAKDKADNVGKPRKKNSKHPLGYAYDVRIKDLGKNYRSSASMWCMFLRDKLGDDYDVVLKSDHIHIEWDRK